MPRTDHNLNPEVRKLKREITVLLDTMEDLRSRDKFAELEQIHDDISLKYKEIRIIAITR